MLNIAKGRRENLQEVYSHYCSVWWYEINMDTSSPHFALLAILASLTGVVCQSDTTGLSAAAGAALNTVSTGLSTIYIVVIVIGVLIVLAVIGCIICCIFGCTSGKRSGRVIAPATTQPQVTVATTAVPPANTGMAPAPQRTY